ncbi:MAG: UDP-glucose/GDP-mannose dehydrogenase family protein [Armatimonadetes bacterium]|nr:UDP-glucose/GDP-mannose dehydrogenase family protein [Armatimonadota bacterium]
MSVSVVGVGRLGAPLAACLASKGYSVVAADTDAAKVAALSRGDAPVREPGLPEMLQEHRGRVRATSDIGEAVRESEITFIVVPTPSEEDGEFSLRHVLAVCAPIGRALRDKGGFPVVVLTSTVMPGATGGAVREALEAASGRRCGREFGLCYSPEFIALGSVIRDMLSPDFILIGESDPRSGDRLAALYGTLCDNSPPVARMNFVNAELAKLAVNTYVTTKISYANMLAGLCERLPEADVDVVTSALGLDGRIGRKYLKGATRYGGPCFPRDNVAFARLARRLGARAPLAEATQEINREHGAALAQVALSRLPPGGTVGILGLSYKPETDVVTESAGVDVAGRLAAAGVRVVAYDPAGMANARTVLGDQVHFAASAAECARASDVLVITTPWEEFQRLSFGASPDGTAPRAVIDCWRVLRPAQREGMAEYIVPGTGPTRS